MEGVNQLFAGKYLQTSNRYRRITSFDEYLNYFIDFMDSVGTNSPFTKTGIVTGLFCNSSISGLCLELSTKDASVDRVKDLDFFMNYFYTSYKATALKHGFLIDRNAPWKLVADIESVPMREHMIQYGVTLDNLFDKYYYRTHTNELASMKVYLEEFYNSFISSQLGVKARRRMGRVNVNYDDDYWIRVYARIRQSEILYKRNEVQFNKIVRAALALRKRYHTGVAMDYINRHFLGKLMPTV